MKKGGPPLRYELGDISYLEAHLEVFPFFKDDGCYRFCEKIQGSHQQVAEEFALSFDGSKAVIGKEEFMIYETLIIEGTELPSIGEKWFKTTIPKDVEFISYLNPEHREVVWKKSVPSSWLEERWHQLLKAIVVYITCERRYNRAMIYHFKLMNHFTGRSPLNFPFYLHRILAKMAHQVKAQPTKIVGRVSHHGLIQLLIQ